MNLLIGLILGVLLFYSLGDPILNKITIQQVAAQSPAADAGLQAGDLIVAVNGETIDSTEKLQSLIESNLGKPTTIGYLRNNQNFTVTLTPRVSPPANQGAMGIVLGHPTQPIGLGAAISRGSQAAFDYGRSVLLLPINLLRGQITPQEGRPVGFKGMFDIYQQVQSPIFFFMVISISLAIFNLFPFPALDGGRILLTLPEIIVRRRIPPQYENMIHLIGFALVLILIIYINVQDFINPLVLPH